MEVADFTPRPLAPADIKDDFLALFGQASVRWPGHTAVRFLDTELSYSELNRLSSQVAHYLAGRGIEPGSVIAVSLGRSQRLLPVLIGILKAGAAYLPLDPHYPAARREYVLADAGARCLIIDDPVNGELDFDGETLDLTSDWGAIELGPHRSPDVSGGPDQLAYMIYTSGSTGNPKGVKVSRANMANFLLAMLERPGIASGDCLLAVTTISFDIHVLELFLPLVAGACVELATREMAGNPQLLRSRIESGEISVLQATPATWRLLWESGWQGRQPLKGLVGGEALPTDLLPWLFANTVELWNMYGPTETTVWSTCHHITSPTAPVMIGTPVRNTQVCVVNEHNIPVADGEAGELLIGGDGVTLGYHDRSDLTDERFIGLEFNGCRQRFYRTGDLVRLHPSGVLEYINRIDNQIKIRGFRIEPGEIEAAIVSLDGVKQAVVTVNHIADGDERLVAHLVGPEAGNIVSIRESCAAMLPPQMLPQQFRAIESLPLTDNGKVDRKALAAIVIDRRLDDDAPHTPARDDLDRSLIKVWEQALGVEGVGIDNDFAHLGGHSLLALRVVADMRRVTGVEFADDCIFRHNTIKRIVDSLGEQVAREAASVVKLNSASQGRPVFCLCGVQLYQDLADEYGDTRPVYGIYAKEEVALAASVLEGGRVDLSIQRLSSTYIEAIRRQQATGPYTLMGVSFGGVLAVEVARLLQQEGEQVDLVVLFDSYLPTSIRWSLPAAVSHAVELVGRGELAALIAKPFRKLAEKIKRLRGNVSGVTDTAVGSMGIDKVRDLVFDEVASQFSHMNVKYSGEVLLIKATQTHFGFGRDCRYGYGWQGVVTGTLSIESVDAGHIDMLHAPCSAILKSFIDRHCV